MGVRHQQLVDQLSPLLKFYVSHPKAVNQANAGMLKELLPLQWIIIADFNDETVRSSQVLLYGCQIHIQLLQHHVRHETCQDLINFR